MRRAVRGGGGHAGSGPERVSTARFRNPETAGPGGPHTLWRCFPLGYRMPADHTRDAGTRTEPREFGLYVGGSWVDSEGGDHRDATNPATGEVVARVPAGTRADARRAIDAAGDAQADLEFRSAFERAALVHDLGDALDANREAVARWLTRDQGKPLAEARVEVDLAAEMYHNAAEDVKRDEPPTLASEHPDKRIFTMRKPHGVLGVITPWNYPLTIPSEYLAPGLAVGNAVVWVPAPSTSAVSLKLAEIFDDAGLPPGALNVVTGEGPVVGNEVVGHDGTDAIGFTGSPETGELVARAAGAKPTLLELGGNGPVVVLDDADVERAAAIAADGSFTNAGQICTASERILVHADVHDEFVDAVVDRAKQIRVGDPTADDTDMGPLNNAEVAAKMDRHVADALDRGATLAFGGHRLEGAPTDLYYEPTVLTGVTREMAVNHEETFGPIAPVIRYDDYDEAIAIANGISLGLSSGVFTTSIEHMYYFAERLETGLVNVNQGSAHWEIHTPIGGYSGKDSGVGRIGGRFTLEELSQLKTVIVDLGDGGA